MEESCIWALVPSLSTKSAKQSSHSHHFKHSVFHIPNHKTKFLRGSRRSSPLRQQKKEKKKKKDYDSDIDSLVSASGEDLENLGEVPWLLRLSWQFHGGTEFLIPDWREEAITGRRLVVSFQAIASFKNSQAFKVYCSRLDLFWHNPTLFKSLWQWLLALLSSKFFLCGLVRFVLSFKKLNQDSSPVAHFSFVLVYLISELMLLKNCCKILGFLFCNCSFLFVFGSISALYFSSYLVVLRVLLDYHIVLWDFISFHYINERNSFLF